MHLLMRGCCGGCREPCLFPRGSTNRGEILHRVRRRRHCGVMLKLLLRQNLTVQHNRLVNLVHVGLAILALWEECRALTCGHLLLHVSLTLPIGNDGVHAMC